ncbi:erythropoietin isoform X2 [Latimeria chalumnae]|uniref:erythropoietin isoform X2 n=1 Tax=Latimeria chalumnae TaxID=7897 RepID=UPI0003C12AAC|nr:PREDICTED: erythropoietin isoform X2 [Latimeria chalumnae]|eukprot:XP_005999844.1 PREDICTED: erythropoietin isoform X2 [Latimeria chalumnae]
MGILGFFTLLLLLLLGCTKPVKTTPVRPVCDTSVMDKFIEDAKDAESFVNKIKEREIWAGINLFTHTFKTVRDFIRDSVTVYHITKSYSNTRSTAQILKRLHTQEIPVPDSPPQKTVVVRTLGELFHIHVNFLRGKVKLFISDACSMQKR